MALVGPTASGKSAVAVEVARALGDVEIVTVDSMQVYRGMDIGTAKPGPDERGGVVHHLLDVADPAEDWDVVRWLGAARRALQAIESRAHRALLVGGTGLYYRALIDGLTPPGRWTEVRAGIEAEPDTALLHRRLTLLDPGAAARIDAGNRRRLVRALEVTVGSGRPFSSWGPGLATYPPTTWRTAGLWLPRAVTGRRIAGRFAAMLDAGLLGEVDALAGAPGGLSRTAGQALGYRELLAHRRGGPDLEEATALAVARTRAFSRRQRMWWRRDPRVAWVGAAENPLAVIPVLLGQWGQP